MYFIGLVGVIVSVETVRLGILLGVIAGLIDVAPMVLQGLTWDANLSAFSLWIVSGFLISTSSIRLNGGVKGILISSLVLLPAAILIGWKDPLSLIPISLMTVILGFLLGHLIEKYGK